MALALISSQLTGKLIQQATNAAVQIGQAIASETNEPLGQTVANELKDISTAYARSFTETVAAATNGLFTANALATTLGWSRNKAFAEADGHERVASNRGQHVGRTTLNESRDPEGTGDRYSSRYFLRHSFLEQAFDTLVEANFELKAAAGTSALSLLERDSKSSQDAEENRWLHYNEFVFVRFK